MTVKADFDPREVLAAAAEHAADLRGQLERALSAARRAEGAFAKDVYCAAKGAYTRGVEVAKDDAASKHRDAVRWLTGRQSEVLAAERGAAAEQRAAALTRQREALGGEERWALVGREEEWSRREEEAARERETAEAAAAAAEVTRRALRSELAAAHARSAVAAALRLRVAAAEAEVVVLKAERRGDAGEHDAAVAALEARRKQQATRADAELDRQHHTIARLEAELQDTRDGV